MGFRIQRIDGTTDGLGDSIVFATLEEAWAVGGRAFAERYGEEELRQWMKVVEVAETAETDGDGNILLARG